MIRYSYINNLILNLYSELPSLKFPIDTMEIIKHIPNCRYMSYQQFAKVNKCSIEDIVQICESKSGCTHYDISNNRYLIMCNQSIQDNNIGRQRWTCSHEIGHILCKHHIISAYEKLSENSLLKITNPEYEAEADYFAATLLSPFPLFKYFNIQSAIDIQNIFGLSRKASTNRFNQYIKWKQNRRKTAWENDLIKIYLQKNIIL